MPSHSGVLLAIDRACPLCRNTPCPSLPAEAMNEGGGASRKGIGGSGQVPFLLAERAR